MAAGDTDPSQPRGVVSDDLVRRLRWHAGFEQGSPPRARWLEAWLLGVEGATLTASMDDVMDVLSQVNVQLNGQVPSEIIEGKAETVPLILPYVVGELVRMLRDETRGRAEDVARAAHDAAWELETAWMAVLAGDIDDLPEHVMLESGARESSTRDPAPAAITDVSVRLLLTCLEGNGCTVFFEPEGADVRLEQGSPLVEELRGEQGGTPEVSYLSEGLIVCAWPGADTRVWDKSGKEIPV